MIRFQMIGVFSQCGHLPIDGFAAAVVVLLRLLRYDLMFDFVDLALVEPSFDLPFDSLHFVWLDYSMSLPPMVLIYLYRV